MMKASTLGMFHRMPLTSLFFICFSLTWFHFIPNILLMAVWWKAMSLSMLYCMVLCTILNTTTSSTYHVHEKWKCEKIVNAVYDLWPVLCTNGSLVSTVPCSVKCTIILHTIRTATLSTSLPEYRIPVVGYVRSRIRPKSPPTRPQIFESSGLSCFSFLCPLARSKRTTCFFFFLTKRQTNLRYLNSISFEVIEDGAISFSSEAINCWFLPSSAYSTPDHHGTVIQNI